MTMFGFPLSANSTEDTSAAVTLWFLTADSVAEVLATEPKADRGFGRKFLAQLNPAWPVTPIGDFPMNRSTPTGVGEFYIAGYPGLTVVQTVLDNATDLEGIDRRLLGALPAREIFVFAANSATGLGGFMHINEGHVERAFCAQRTHVFTDTGLPEPFEGPFWAGEVGEQLGGITLPFAPVDLMHAAEEAWLGINVSPNGPDINVSAFAVDGRPAPRFDEHGTLIAPDGDPAASPSSENAEAYDDYENTPADRERTGDEFARLAEASMAVAKRLTRSAWRRALKTGHVVTERIRHIDR